MRRQVAKELSILIPARNEQFLARTVQDILENIEADTEIIVGLDGMWADPGIPQHERVTVVYYPESIGQRAMTNRLCALSSAKYVAKTDAHCAFDKGFDRKLIEAIKGHDNWLIIPQMKNLHAFDWVCGCGHRHYQGPTTEKCEKCGGKMEREMIWKPKRGVTSTFYRFDNTMHFQYWGDFAERSEAKGDIAPTMSIQGSFFMLTREKYWELDISSEQFKSWGQQGIECACKTWLSGGEVMVCKNTWYAHMFRTQGGDFGFPYPNPGSDIDANRKLSRELFMNNKWEKAVHPFSWLLEKFSPVPDWSASKGILYYTDNQLDEKIAKACQKRIIDGVKGRRIVSVSLKPLDFGDNVTLPLERGYLTMAKQILAGLKELSTDVVFFCEHDVFYDPSHFDFVPTKKDCYYYNTNVWRVRLSDGHGVKVDDCRQLSGLCAYRDLLIKHYEERVKKLEAKVNDLDFKTYVRKMGFEPGTHNREERVDKYKSDKWDSAKPNLDIRHDGNLTSSRWKKSDFRNQKYTIGWTESDNVAGWGELKELMK